MWLTTRLDIKVPSDLLELVYIRTCDKLPGSLDEENFCVMLGLVGCAEGGYSRHLPSNANLAWHYSDQGAGQSREDTFQLEHLMQATK